MKRILLDQGLAPLAAAILRESGWDALHVSEAGLQSADDIEILNAARHDGRICITLDHDFHSHLELTGADSPSVVFLRIQGLDAREQASFIRGIWETCEDVLAGRVAVSADLTSVRIRRLPLR